jgi:sigma-B regulation protein RsbU (phosphoserine phosphatase)
VKLVDLSKNRRIDTLIQMVGEISTATSPIHVFSAFVKHYWVLRPMDYMVSMSTKDLPEGQYRITREYDVKAMHVDGIHPVQVDHWKHRDLIPVHSGGFLGDLIAAKRPQIVEYMEVIGDPVVGNRLAKMRSACVMPLFDEGVPRYWNIQFRREPNAFTQDELEQGLLIANLTGGNNTRLLLVEEIKKLNATLKQQFEDVARVQRSLLPSKTPEIPNLEIATSYLTSEQAGGDYFDFFPFADGTWGIMIADVSGHGAAAATVMAMLHGILHAYSGPARTPDAVLRWTNERLISAGIEGTFVTAFLGIYDPKTGTLKYARSGHNPPLLKGGNSGRVRVLDGDGALPLGVFDPYEITSETVQLQPGDTVVLYTDGITEAFNSLREMFGETRLRAALVECSGQPDCVVDSVHSALFKHTGSMKRADDQTLVAVQYKGKR